MESLPGVRTPPHFALCLLLQLQTGLASPNFVYPMYFTRYSVQWRLRKFTLSNLQFLLNNSTENEQQPRIRVMDGWLEG